MWQVQHFGNYGYSYRVRLSAGLIMRSFCEQMIGCSLDMISQISLSKQRESSACSERTRSSSSSIWTWAHLPSSTNAEREIHQHHHSSGSRAGALSEVLKKAMSAETNDTNGLIRRAHSQHSRAHIRTAVISELWLGSPTDSHEL